MLLVQAFLPTLRASGQGRIVNMSSRAALGKGERIVYSATKAGMIGMTRTLAMELGRDGITVNAIGPGPIATELFRQSNPKGAPQTQRILNSIAVGRMGTPDDVARAALFFLSPDNGFVTGQVLYVGAPPFSPGGFGAWLRPWRGQTRTKAALVAPTHSFIHLLEGDKP
eukprot:gene2900-2942_t